MTFQEFWENAIEQVWPIVLISAGALVLVVLFIVFLVKCCCSKSNAEGDNIPLLQEASRRAFRVNYRKPSQSNGNGMVPTGSDPMLVSDGVLSWHEYLNNQVQVEVERKKDEDNESRISAETFLRNAEYVHSGFKLLSVIGRRLDKSWFAVEGTFTTKDVVAGARSSTTTQRYLLSVLPVSTDQWPYRWKQSVFNQLKGTLDSLKHPMLLPLDKMEFNATRKRIVLQFPFATLGSILDYQNEISPLASYQEKRRRNGGRPLLLRQSVDVTMQVLRACLYLHSIGLLPILYIHRANLLIRAVDKSSSVMKFHIQCSGFESRILCRDGATMEEQLSVLARSDTSYEFSLAFMRKFNLFLNENLAVNVHDSLRIAVLLLELSSGRAMSKELLPAEKLNRLLRLHSKGLTLGPALLSTVESILHPLFDPPVKPPYTPTDPRTPSLMEIAKMELFREFEIPEKDKEIATELNLPNVIFQYSEDFRKKLQRRSSLQASSRSSSSNIHRRSSAVASGSSSNTADKTTSRRQQTTYNNNLPTLDESHLAALPLNGGQGVPQPPPPPPPPPPPASTASMSMGQTPATIPNSKPGTGALLQAIRQGKQLKRVTEVNDRSQPII